MRYFLISLLCLLFSSGFALEDSYTFSSTTQHERFGDLTKQLRCLVCQNETLADSNAALAVDLRQQIHQQILAGKSDREIIDYLVDRYGQFILYRPPFALATLGLWLAPFLLLVIGISYLIYYLHYKKRGDK